MQGKERNVVQLNHLSFYFYFKFVLAIVIEAYQTRLSLHAGNTVI